MMQFQSLMEIKNAVFAARQAALAEARSCGRGYAPSRGTYLATAGNGVQCSPRPSADCPTWNGTLKEITDLIALVERDYRRKVEEITIGGGYDHADSQQAYRDGDYTPWASSWEIVVWRSETRNDGSSWGADEATMANGEAC